MAGKEDLKFCENCKEKINLQTEKYVIVSTRNKPKKLEHDAYFHFSCWVKYFNDCVSKKAKIIVETMRDKCLGIIKHPIINSVLSQVQGTNILTDMLQTPLNVNKTKINEIKEKIYDRRNTRKSRNTTSKPKRNKKKM